MGNRDNPKGEAGKGYGGRDARRTAAAASNSGKQIHLRGGSIQGEKRGEKQRRGRAIRGHKRGDQSLLETAEFIRQNSRALPFLRSDEDGDVALTRGALPSERGGRRASGPGLFLAGLGFGLFFFFSPLFFCFLFNSITFD